MTHPPLIRHSLSDPAALMLAFGLLNAMQLVQSGLGIVLTLVSLYILIAKHRREAAAQTTHPNLSSHGPSAPHTGTP